MLEQFKNDVEQGLGGFPKTLPSKYFYDKKGDALFVQIMNLPEYYLTRAEHEIFKEQGNALIRALEVTPDKHFELIELGPGDGTKTKELLKVLYQQDYQFDYLPIDISQNALDRLEPAPGGDGSHRATLIGGSVLTGVLASTTLKFKLALGPLATVRREDVLRLTGTGKGSAPAGVTVVTMRNGDRLVATLAHKVLTVRTEFGPAKVFPVSVLKATFDATKAGAVVMTMWDGSTIEGQLVAPDLTFIAHSGPTVKVAPAHIASITRPYALPGPETVRKVAKLIAQLGAESYTDREAATRELLKMGKGVMPLLKKHANSHDSEIRQRIEDLLGQLSPKKPEPAAPPNIGRWTKGTITTD